MRKLKPKLPFLAHSNALSAGPTGALAGTQAGDTSETPWVRTGLRVPKTQPCLSVLGLFPGSSLPAQWSGRLLMSGAWQAMALETRRAAGRRGQGSPANPHKGDCPSPRLSLWV